MLKLMMILAIVTAFCVDTAIKSVCAYNKRLEQKQSILQNSEVSHLGTTLIRYNKVLNCKNKDKPFVYEKQMKQIMLMSKSAYNALVDQSIIDRKEAPSLENLLLNTE